MRSFDFSRDPIDAFQRELENAQSVKVNEPTAMQLASVDSKGNPSLRTVLYKGMYHSGFGFFTNLKSPKAQELTKHPNCSLLFFWPSLSQQIRIQGEVKRLSRQENEDYFRTRPRLSQIGAWASDQSSEIPDFLFLEKKVAEVEKKYAGKEIPCPEQWGGFVCQPLMMEFWFGREGRLHERYVYERVRVDAQWRRYLRSP